MTPLMVIVPQPVPPPSPMQLREALSARGMRAAELAQIVGVHPAQISRWIAGGRIPTPHLRAVSRALNVPVEQLLPPAPVPAEQDRAA